MFIVIISWHFVLFIQERLRDLIVSAPADHFPVMVFVCVCYFVLVKLTRMNLQLL